MNAQLKEIHNLDPRNRQRTWVEDIEIKVRGHVAYFSVEADHELDVDGKVLVRGIYYNGKAITALPALVDLVEQHLEEERS